MALVRIDGICGRVFIPDRPAGAAPKHPCPDCHDCQHCGDARCSLCRDPEPGEIRKPDEASSGP